jgi:hypothetical protein
LSIQLQREREREKIERKEREIKREGVGSKFVVLPRASSEWGVGQHGEGTYQWRT